MPDENPELAESQKKPKYERFEFAKYLWNNIKNKFVYGWRSTVRVHERYRFLDDNKQTADMTTEYSHSFKCEPYTRALFLMNFGTETGAPTMITVGVEFSWDNVTWHRYQRDPWDAMNFVAAETPGKYAMDLPIIAPFVRISTITSGGSSTKYWPLTVDGVFVSGA